MTKLNLQEVITGIGELLVDITPNGQRIPWEARKLANQYLALVYDQVDPAKADRLRSCAHKLIYGVREGRKKLVNGFFCRVRLCPICQWRRSLKNYVQMSEILRWVAQHQPQAYIFLTLTVKNCNIDQLSVMLDNLYAAWDRMRKTVQFSRVVNGWYRGLEITHNVDRSSKDFDTYHPHIHAVLAVNPSYFKSKNYLSQTAWRDLWKRSMRLDYDPQVDIRRIKGDTTKAVSEVTKYAVKSKDYILLDDWDLTVDTVANLDRILDKRRFVGLGGIFKDAHKSLHLDDVDDGDLVKLTPDEITDQNDLVTQVYTWFTGYNQYRKTDEF